MHTTTNKWNLKESIDWPFLVDAQERTLCFGLNMYLDWLGTRLQKTLHQQKEVDAKSSTVDEKVYGM